MSLDHGSLKLLATFVIRMEVEGWGTPEELRSPADVIYVVSGSHIAAHGMGQLNIPGEVHRIMGVAGVQGKIYVQ